MSPILSVESYRERVHDEVLRENVPGLLHTIKENYFHRSIGTPKGQGCNYFDEQV